jgi:hypothetical protein
LIIACIGDISKFKSYIWSSYGLLAEKKKSSHCPLLFFSKFMAKRTLMAIRSVIGKSWGPLPECAKWSWTGVMRPALTYGAIVWSRTASQAWAKKKLQQLQRLALSQISHVRPSTPMAALVKPDTSWQSQAKARARVAHGRHLQHQFLAGL